MSDSQDLSVAYPGDFFESGVEGVPVLSRKPQPVDSDKVAAVLEAAEASGVRIVGAPDDLGKKNVDELKALVEAQSLTVEGTGSNGQVVKGDLLKALNGEAS